MPMIRIEMLAGRTAEKKQELATALTREIARIAGCAPDDVQLVIAEVAHEHWAVGGRFAAAAASE